MLSSFTSPWTSRLAGSAPWLICLDLQREYVVPGRPGYAPAGPDVAAVCLKVLDHARAAGWRVVHSQLRRHATSPFGAALFGAPIEGLRPLISEPVFFRGGLSAFANPAFAAELARARGDEVFLIGFSLADTCLATALAAVDHGLSLVLVEDALGAGQSPAASAPEIARAILGRFVGFVSSDEIEAAAMELAL